MQRPKPPRIIMTGATGFLGYRVLVALTALGAEVTALVPADRQDALEMLGDTVQIVVGDVWNKASLKGRARNHDVVIHLVGSAHIDPQRGLTYEQVNLTSARHVIGMAVSDGVPQVMLLSTVVRPLELPGAYVRSKRDAEGYLKSSGAQWTIIRAPGLYTPRKSPFLVLISALGRLFPFSLLVGRYLPFSVEAAARGIAAVAVQGSQYTERILYMPDLRRAARRIGRGSRQPHNTAVNTRASTAVIDDNDVDEHFGWTPPH